MPALEVWPEANILPHWREGGPDPEEYSRLLRAVATAVKRAAPGTRIVSGAPAPNAELGVCYLSDLVFLDRLALTGLRRAKAIVAVSNYTKQTLADTLRIPAHRIHVAYEAVDSEHFRPQEVPQSFRVCYRLEQGIRNILYVGSEDPRKNLPTLIRALAEVKQRVGEVRLLKVGASQFSRERQRLSTLIAEAGLEHDVRFFERVPEEDLPLFYSAADVLVLPSLYEGFGLPVLEAMACGTPVVCSRETSLPEVAGPAALLVSPRRPDELAGALVKVLSDRSLADEMRRKGLMQAATFTPERLAAGAMQAYASVVAMKPRSQEKPLG